MLNLRTLMPLAAVTVLAVTPLAPAAAQAPAKVSSPGKYAGYSPELYSEYVRTNFFVEARDGVRLAVTLYRPAKNGKAVDTPYPVLFQFTPYQRLSKTHPAGAEATSRSRAEAELTRYGYSVAVADVRGKGASFGVRWAYQDDNEARDGYDLVEWLGRQPWSDGNVGMFGCSYYGGTQLAAARLAPPHLKAIFVRSGPFDAYRMSSKGGISGQFNTRYQSNDEDIGVMPVDSDPDGKLAAQARAQHAANGQMLDFLTNLPFRDDRDGATDIPYWKVVSPYEHLDVIAKSGLAIYLWGDWMDEITDQSVISYATFKANPRKLMMTGGTHCGAGNVDLFTEELRFFDHYLKKIDNGIDREAPVAYETLGAPGLTTATAWPPVDSRPVDWALNAAPSRTIKATAFDGSLGPVAGRKGRNDYQVNYKVGCIIDPRFSTGVGKPAPGEENDPQPGYWPCVLDDVGATYTSAPLKTPMHLAGAPIVTLRMALDQPDANVFAYLEQVKPDGTATVVAHGRLKASARKVFDPPYDNLGNPWHSNARADSQPLKPGESFEMQMEMGPTSAIIPAGDRLRVTITGADLRQRNLKRIMVNPPPVMSIATGEGGSFIRLPVVTPPKG